MSASVTSAACVEDLVSKINALPKTNKKTYHIFSEDELMDKTKGLSFPYVGVIYDGLRATSESGSSAKQGHSAELVCTVMLLFRQESGAAQDSKLNAVGVLDTIRSAVKGTRSPSGHFWQFKMEAAVGSKNGVLAYIQRWACPVQLT